MSSILTGGVALKNSFRAFKTNKFFIPYSFISPLFFFFLFEHYFVFTNLSGTTVLSVGSRGKRHDRARGKKQYEKFSLVFDDHIKIRVTTAREVLRREFIVEYKLSYLRIITSDSGPY